MLDLGPPPPALYEQAPSGLYVPSQPWQAVLPGFTPGALPGLGGGGFGVSKVPPWPAPTVNKTNINQTSGTSGATATQNAASSVTFSAYSEVLVWCAARVNQLNDPNNAVFTVTDNQSGTYTGVGPVHKFSYNNAGTMSTFWCQLQRRNGGAGSGGLGATLITQSVTIAGTASTSTWNSGYVFEILNPAGLVGHVDYKALATATTTPISMTATGELYMLDCFAGLGAAVAESTDSGFTSLAGAASFVSNQLRLQVYGSGFRAQNPARTIATAALASICASYSIYFDGPVRSRSAIAWQYVAKYTQFTAANSFTITGASIGTAAADRMVHVLVMPQVSVGLSVTSFTTTPSPALSWQMFLPSTGGQMAPNYMYSALMPTGSTMNIVINTSQNAYYAVYIYVTYGQAMFGPNQVGMIAGDVTPRSIAPNSQTSPLNQTGIIVPARSVLIGGGHGYTSPITSSGTATWTVDDSNAGSGGLAANLGAHIDNTASGTDLTGQIIGIQYSGSQKVGVFGQCLGP